MSFKRKEEITSSKLSPGVRLSPSSSVRVVSTGLPSLDDILGGGIPLTSNILILGSNPHAAYGDIIQKYFIAQGIASSQRVCVFGDSGQGLDVIRQCMWLSGPQALPGTEDKDDKKTLMNEKKIAWRYKHLGSFRTTVEASSSIESVYRLIIKLCNNATNLVLTIVKISI